MAIAYSMRRRSVLLLLLIPLFVGAQNNPAPSEAETWATTVLNYGDQSTASSLDKDLTALVFTRPESYPLFLFEYSFGDDLGQMATTGASTFEDTRAIALTHPGQFIGEGVTTEFWDSVLDWVTYGDLNVKIAVGFASHQNFLEQRGATNVELIDFDESGVVLVPIDATVLILDYSSYNVWSDALMDRLYQTTAEFVSRPSSNGVVIGGESRFYKWTHYGSCSLFPANRIFAQVGIVYICDWWSSRGFDMEIPSGSYLDLHLYHSVNFLDSITAVRPLTTDDAALTMGPTVLARSLRGVFIGCFCDGDVNAPIATSQAMHSLVSSIIASGNCIVNMPVSSSDTPGQICEEMAYYAAVFESAPSNVVAAPSSAVFPLMNEVFQEEDFVTASVLVDSDRCQDISTGLFVPPGRVVSLTIPQEWVGAVRAGVGQWRVDTHRFSTWTRNPNSLHFYYDLPTGTTEFASGFGGMLYINVKCETDFIGHFGGRVTGEIEATNVLKAVYFQAGLTDEADWESQLGEGSDRIAPWMELEVRDIVFTVPRTIVESLSFAHVQEVADYWNLVTQLYADFRDQAPDEFKERGVVDAMVAYGYMFASYPMVGPLGEASNVFDLTAFYASGTWGWLHEIGHRYERGNSYGPEAGSLWNMFSGNVEVFTNVFTCQAIDNTIAENSRCSDATSGVAQSLSGSDWSEMGAFDKLDFYVGQKLAFGWDSFSHAITRGRTYRFPADDIERRTRLWLLFSEEVGRNVGPMFDAWGIAVDTEMLSEQIFLVDQVSLGIRFSSPLTDIGSNYASSFAVGAALLAQPAPNRLFPVSQSVQFGGNDNGDISGPMPFNTGNAMTVTIWLYLESSSDSASLVEAIDGTLNSLWSVTVLDGLDGHSIKFTWPTGSASSATVVPLGTWTHVAVTSDGSQGTIYVNGNVDSTFSTEPFGSDPSNRMVFNHGGLLQGSLAELGYFQSVLAGGRIQAQFLPSPFGFAPWIAADFMPAALQSCPSHILPQGIVACNTFAGVRNQPASECDACLAHICDGAAAPHGVDCSSTCPPGTLVNTNGLCDECHETCAECTAAGDNAACSACSETTGFPYAQGTACVGACSSGFALVGDSCEPCHSTCATCEATGTADCTSCDSLLLEDGFCVASCSGSKFEHEGDCVSSCPSGFFPGDGVCGACAPSCETCEGPSSLDCLSCSNEAPFLTVGGSCLSLCPAGEYPDGFTCIVCDSECSTCENGQDCTTCDQAGSIPWFFEFQCLAECPAFTTEDGGTFTCNGCDIYGQEPYDSQGECVSECPQFNFQYQCVASCPAGHFADPVTRECTPCDENCEACAESADYCTSCSSASVFPFLLGSECVTVCPTGTFASANVCADCSDNCESCSEDASNCESCSSLLPQLLDGECLAECPVGYFSELSQCFECHDDCLSCFGPSVQSCIACQEGDYLIGGSCTSSCPSGTFADDTSKTCLDCGSVCLSCSESATRCTSCDTLGTFPVLEGFTCVEACEGFDLVGECVLACPAGFFEDGDACTSCDVSCQSCEGSPANCLVCNRSGPRPHYDTETSQCLANCGTVDRFAFEGICVTSCPLNYFADTASQECRLCQTPCAECADDASSCTSCEAIGDFPFLFEGACLAECPTGFYEAASRCLVCDSSCETCSGASETSCTGCRFGFQLDPSGACVEKSTEECPGDLSSLQGTSAVASWPQEHTSVSQVTLCLDGTNIGEHCIPYGSQLVASINVQVVLTATVRCSICDDSELVSAQTKTVRQEVTVAVGTTRSLLFLNSLLSAEVVDEQLEELFLAASSDNTLNVNVISVAEQVFSDALASIGLANVCEQPRAVVDLIEESVAIEGVELAAVGRLSDGICPLPATPAWNEGDTYQPRCICDASVDATQNPCNQLAFAPFSEGEEAICHPMACSLPKTDQQQWIEVVVELDTNFFDFDDAATKEILSEIVDYLQLNTEVLIGDVYLARMDIGSVLMTLMIDSSRSFEDDYEAAELLVDVLNSEELTLSATVIVATVVTPNNPSESVTYSTAEPTDTNASLETNSLTTVDEITAVSNSESSPLASLGSSSADGRRSAGLFASQSSSSSPTSAAATFRPACELSLALISLVVVVFV